MVGLTPKLDNFTELCGLLHFLPQPSNILTQISVTFCNSASYHVLPCWLLGSCSFGAINSLMPTFTTVQLLSERKSCVLKNRKRVPHQGHIVFISRELKLSGSCSDEQTVTHMTKSRSIYNRMKLYRANSPYCVRIWHIAHCIMQSHSNSN